MEWVRAALAKIVWGPWKSSDHHILIREGIADFSKGVNIGVEIFALPLVRHSFAVCIAYLAFYSIFIKKFLKNVSFALF